MEIRVVNDWCEAIVVHSVAADGTPQDAVLARGSRADVVGVPPPVTGKKSPTSAYALVPPLSVTAGLKLAFAFTEKCTYEKADAEYAKGATYVRNDKWVKDESNYNLRFAIVVER